MEKRIPAMFRMYMKYGIDMRKVPIVIYPTLHYQNGGLEITGDGFTKEIPNLLVAGEAAGGIHGRNRLMGNSFWMLLYSVETQVRKQLQNAKR